jgi:hypothetical protein
MAALPPWRAALLAIVSVATATVVMWALQASLHRSFLVFFVAATAFSALAGGRRAAALAIILSMVAYPAVSLLSGAGFGFPQVEVELVLLLTSGLIAWFGIREQESRRKLAQVIVELQQALEEVRTLRGMIPICASCKKIRDDHGYWIALERYIQERTYAQFTHGMCRECILKYYPEVYPQLFPGEDAPTKKIDAKSSRG